MSDNYKFMMILHFSDFKGNYFLKLFNQKKKIEGKEILFEFSKNKFKPFQYFLPTRLYILDKCGKKILGFTLNLIKGKNTYHLFSEGAHVELYELLFYNEEKVELIVDGKEIKEYDSISKFKRFSLINILKYTIKINGTEINLTNVLQNTDKSGNSYQLSFYDISKKYIVSKKIKPIQNMNFSMFYRKYINDSNDFSVEFEKLTSNKDEFKNSIDTIYQQYFYIYNAITSGLNLKLPKQELENMLKEENNLDFIYSYIKMNVFFTF